MFEVIVLACSVATPTDCWEWVDTRGPYPKREQCVARAYAMSNAIAEVHKGAIMPKAYRCKVLKGTEL